SEHTIKHRLMTFAASGLNHRNRMPVVFEYRAVVEKNGLGYLEEIGLKAQDTQALIGYAFWTVAPQVKHSSWWQYRSRKCSVCSRSFWYPPSSKGGRPRTTCLDPTCRKV